MASKQEHLVCELLCPLRLPNKSRRPTWQTGSRSRPFLRLKGYTASNIRASSSSAELPDIIKQVGQSLWGKGLPPGALVGAVRSAWTSGWAIMMKQLAPSDKQGGYQRPKSKFQKRLLNPVSVSDHGRYHLYVSLTCPWAHRTAIVHALKGLGDAVPLSIAVPNETGLWEFRPHQGMSTDHHILLPTVDRAHKKARLMDVYKLTKGGYDGRATVPMLWDSFCEEVVNNESADIIEILNMEFNIFACDPQLDLAPPHLQSDIEKWNDLIYPNINNGVYRCGFAQGQEAYDEAINVLFTTLDMLEEHLASSKFLCGDILTLADIRLFTTLYRFDPVYYVLFKCSKKKLLEYPSLYRYLGEIFQMSGVAATCDLPTIMDGYYKVLFPLNPGGIRPVIPVSSHPTSLCGDDKQRAVSSSIRLSSTP
ncbi:hypothetical protein GOP47_0000928 [Adiantum capillus-veneris]|uniref:GST C-terminal domain-containing protein n=1 Tax=Adiantum capillus-veneris TaxID=13818 RepID=A0A9D4ZQZ6_ADICA|nr:hypothetical protein GOP47_0000928 [Adiantum capillus-veneris]